MQAEAFFERVRNEGKFESQADAEAIAVATFETLGERIGDGQAEKLTADLPDDLAAALLEAIPDEVESLALGDFLDRVGERAGVEESEALVGVRATVDAARDPIDESELEDAREQLPAEFDLLFDTGEFLAADELLDAVQDRAGLDSTDAAEAATTATLETFGERLSAGETADLATYLPEEFRATITEPSAEQPAEFGVEEFVARVADREGVEERTAESHARAVVGVLADVVGDREFRKARSQLLDEYRSLFEAGDRDGE